MGHHPPVERDFAAGWCRIEIMKVKCWQRIHAHGIALAAGFTLAFMFALTFRANAQITVLKPLHLSQVHGVVTDRAGKPVANAEVVLVRKKSVASKTKTDDRGRFALDRVSGQYWLRVSGVGYSPAAREVIIGPDLETVFRRAELYVMLEPGACSDDCSLVYTNKKKFDRAVRWNTGNFD